MKLYILNENPYKHLRQWQFIHAMIAGFIIFAITEHSNYCVHVCVWALWCFVTFCYWPTLSIFLQWRHNGSDGVSNNQPRDCSLKRSFGCRSKNAPKLPVTGLFQGNSPMTGEFLAQRASNVENVSIWWRHHVLKTILWGPSNMCVYSHLNQILRNVL